MVETIAQTMPWVFGAAVVVAMATAAWMSWQDRDDEADFEPDGDASVWPRRPRNDQHPTL